METESPIVDWFTEFYDMYDLPRPDDFDTIFNTIESEIGVIPNQVLGSGSFGLAMLTNRGTVLKFTMDDEEALLWNSIKELEESTQGILRCYGVYHLASSSEGELPLYLIHLEYAPYKLPDDISHAIRMIQQEVMDNKTQETIRIAKAHGRKEAERYSRILWAKLYEKAYRQASIHFPELKPIANLIRTLNKKHGMVTYDLHPGNFMLNKNREVVLVDPSLPSFRHKPTNPELLMIERVDQAINLNNIPILWL